MTTIGQLRRDAAKRLKEGGLESVDIEARVLTRFALGVSLEELVIRDREEAPKDAAGLLAKLVERRLAGEPLAYITGEREFFSRSFLVSRETLIPRPETELLVAVALTLVPEGAAAEVLDLGTGSGVILLTLLAERPGARGTGLDRDAGALAVARRNAERIGTANRVRWIQGDWRSARGRRFDLVVANPPYIPSSDVLALDLGIRAFEPMLAFDGGPDGMSAYRQIAALLPEIIENQGVALLECGAGQARSIRHIVAESGLHPAGTVRDSLGHERVIAVARNAERARKTSEILLEYGVEIAMFRAGI